MSSHDVVDVIVSDVGEVLLPQLAQERLGRLEMGRNAGSFDNATVSLGWGKERMSSQVSGEQMSAR